MNAEAATWLWLFSSNRRALYAQDVSNVVGLPEGTHYQFRYREQWVGSQAASDWAQLAGRTGLVVFSFQHPAHLHPAAFVPIRLATAVSSTVEGSFRLVTFEVARNVSLLSHSRFAGADPSAGSVSFTSGVSTTTLSVTFTHAGSQTLTATQGGVTGFATTTVNPGTASKFGLSGVGTTATAGNRTLAVVVFSSPAGLQVDLRIVGETDASYGIEGSVMPLPDGIDLVDHLARH